MHVWRNPRLSERMSELDGLRGLALLAVVLRHYVGEGVRRVGLHPWQEHSSILTYLAAITGLASFFVLSGFLIGGILYDSKESKDYFRTFFARRVFRICPLYCLWFLLFLIGLMVVGTNSGASSEIPLYINGRLSWDPRAIFNLHIPLWSFPVFLQNIAIKPTGGGVPIWMGVTWSLGVEVQFYLLVTLPIRKLNGPRIAWMAAALILIALIVRLSIWLSGDFFVRSRLLLPCQADAFGLGILTALACREKAVWQWLSSHRWLLYGLLLIFGSGFETLYRYPGLIDAVGLTMIDLFCTVVLLLLVVNPGRLEKRFFGSWVLVKLGDMSYAVYVMHLGISALLHYAFFRENQVGNALSMSVTALAFGVAPLLAAASWHFVEKPFIRYSYKTFRYG